MTGTQSIGRGDDVAAVPADGEPALATAGSALPRLGVRPALDGLRGVAVSLVVLVHAGDSLWPEGDTWLAQGGPLGVHLFFVLSGFLITTVLLGEAGRTGRIRVGAFAVRRIRRLLPVLLALVVALFVVAAFRPIPTLKEAVSTAAYTLSFTSNDAARGAPLPLVPRLGGDRLVLLEALHTWSLAIEVQFYVLWALFLWVAVRLRWSFRTLAVLTAVAVGAIGVVRLVAFTRGTTPFELYFATWSRIDAPLIGSLAGICFAAGWLRRPPRWLVPAGVVGLLAVLGFAFGMSAVVGAYPAGLYTVLAVAGALVVAAVVAVPESALARVLSWRPLVALGLISYSLYIWHAPMFVTVFREDPEQTGPLLAVAGIALALVVAVISYRLIERPFLHRRAADPPASAAPPAATTPAVPADATAPTVPAGSRPLGASASASAAAVAAPAEPS